MINLILDMLNWVNETLCFVIWQTDRRVICISNLEVIVQDFGNGFMKRRE